MEETRQKVILLIGSPGDCAAMAEATARLAAKLDVLFVAQLEARIEAEDLPTSCSNEMACPEPAPCGSGSFCGYGNYYPALSIEESVANALREHPRLMARPYVPKTIGTPYRGYASTYRRHRR